MLTVLWLTVWYLVFGMTETVDKMLLLMFAVECIGYNVNVNFYIRLLFVAKVVEF